MVPVASTPDFVIVQVSHFEASERLLPTKMTVKILFGQRMDSTLTFFVAGVIVNPFKVVGLMAIPGLITLVIGMPLILICDVTTPGGETCLLLITLPWFGKPLITRTTEDGLGVFGWVEPRDVLGITLGDGTAKIIISRYS